MIKIQEKSFKSTYCVPNSKKWFKSAELFLKTTKKIAKRNEKKPLRRTSALCNNGMSQHKKGMKLKKM
jgi:hypothetical protein